MFALAQGRDSVAGALAKVERLLAVCEVELFAALDAGDPCDDWREIRRSLSTSYAQLTRCSIHQSTTATPNNPRSTSRPPPSGAGGGVA